MIKDKAFIFIRRVLYIVFGTLGDLIFWNKKYIVILCYHSIADDRWRFSINKESFEKQLSFLSSRYDFWNVDNLANYLNGKEKLVGRSKVIITFDDGYQDILAVQETLAKYHLKPVVFVIADSSKANRSELETDRKLLNANDLMNLAGDGWFIGSHTSTHQILTKLTKEDLKVEILGSKSILEKLLSKPVDLLAYPKGNYNEDVVRETKTSGYKLAFTMDDRLIGINTDRLKIPRVGIDRSHDMVDFENTIKIGSIYFRGVIKYLKNII